MRCPKCSGWIAIETTSHAECGWKAGVTIPAAAVVTGVTLVADDRATAEQVEAHIQRMREILRAPVKPPPLDGPVKKLERAHAPITSDEGHGTNCFCEVCWRAREEKRRQRLAGPTTLEAPNITPEEGP